MWLDRIRSLKDIILLFEYHQIITILLRSTQDAYFKPTPTMTREKLEEYRKKWTTDNEVGRQYRFQTETRTAGNAVNKSFQTLSVRFLPGTPKALEDFRERLIEKYGILAVCVLRFSLGNSDFIHFRNLKAAITSIGVEIKPYDLNQVRLFPLIYVCLA